MCRKLWILALNRGTGHKERALYLVVRLLYSETPESRADAPRSSPSLPSETVNSEGLPGPSRPDRSRPVSVIDGRK